MNALFLSLALATLLVPADDRDRKPNPFAPSLRQLTDEEEDKLDELIDRFIAADIGKLTGEEAKKATREFEKLGPDAIPALIRGLNRAAKIEASCPAAVITRKLGRMLAVTEDRELLDYARENIGIGVGRSRHTPLLQDLRTACVLRKSALARRPAAAPAPAGERSLRTASVEDLARLAGSERGERLKAVLTELGTRRGDAAIAALGTAAASYEKEIQQLARTQLDRVLSRESVAVVKEKLSDDRAEVRAAAVRLVAVKRVRAEAELIDRLTDEDATVREAAHKALVTLSGGVDHGPAAGADAKAREAAVRKWRAWLEQRGRR